MISAENTTATRRISPKPPELDATITDMGKQRSTAKSAGYVFRCSEQELDALHEEAAHHHTTLQALMEHKLLDRPLATARQRRLASRQEELPLTG